MAVAPRKPRASEAKVEYHRKQLVKMFARANDAAFLQMIWAVDALQSDRDEAAKPYLFDYPPQAAASSSLRSPYGMYRWELETLVVQLLLAPKEPAKAEGNLILDCSKFEAARETIKRLRALENVEAARYLAGDFTIWGEMHRIAHRQFHWQRGYLNHPQFYRYSYLYGTGTCADYFKQAHGLEISDLILTGFGLYSHYVANPWVARQTSVPEIGLTDEIVQRAFPLLSSSRDEARAATIALVEQAQAQHGSPIPTALLPSILRRTPLIYGDEEGSLIAPIPEVILMRITAGLYYDLLPGGQDVINDANSRFETYCADLIKQTMKRFDVRKSYLYGPNEMQVASPDILVNDKGKLAIVAECKATKLTYLAQFAEDPFDAAERQYLQLAKAVFQLWRFFSHIRRGWVQEDLAPDCYAVVLTLDAFLLMAREPQDKVFAEANALADDDGNILAEDRKAVTICSASDLEFVLLSADEDGLIATLKASTDKRYQGWMLREVHRDSGAAKKFGDYPFDLSDVLPWWRKIDDVEEHGEGLD